MKSWQNSTKYLGIVTRRLCNLQVLLPEDCTKVSRRLPECCRQVSLQGGCKYFREYLRNKKYIFENILGCCPGAFKLLICEKKNQSSKISCTCPFNFQWLFIVEKCTSNQHFSTYSTQTWKTIIYSTYIIIWYTDNHFTLTVYYFITAVNHFTSE